MFITRPKYNNYCNSIIINFPSFADELRDINIFAVAELCAVLVLLSVRGCCGVVHFKHPFDYKVA